MYNKFLDYLKSYNLEDVVNSKDIKIRKRYYSLLKLGLLVANPYKLHIIRKATIPKDVPIIFTPTHGFKDDLLNSMIIINNPAYTLFGSIDQFYNTFDGILAHLFGVVIVDRDDEKSRETSLPKMKRAMDFGTNGIIFPEGSWNLTDSELSMKLFSGFYELAKSTKALIVPIITHIEGEDCYGIQDEAFDVTKYTKDEAKEILRNKFATLKWELMSHTAPESMLVDGEKYNFFSREKLESNGKTLKMQWEETKEKLKKEPKYYINEKEIRYPYKDKSIISAEEVFSVLDKVEPTKDNAMVLAKTINKK